MAGANIQSKTGNAQIDRVGHTANGKHGSDPSARAHSRPPYRDLKVSTSR